MPVLGLWAPITQIWREPPMNGFLDQVLQAHGGTEADAIRPFTFRASQAKLLEIG